jgi:hypothetical protein
MAQSHYEFIRNANIPFDFTLASVITNLFVMTLAALQPCYFKVSKSATWFIRNLLPPLGAFPFRTLGAAAGSELTTPQAVAKRYNGYPRIPALDEVIHTICPMCWSVTKATGLTVAAPTHL